MAVALPRTQCRLARGPEAVRHIRLDGDDRIARTRTCTHGRSLRRSAGGEAERVALRVLADRPPRAGVDDRPSERAHLIERGGEIRNREVGQRERVAGPATACVEPDRGTAGPGLPAVP